MAKASMIPNILAVLVYLCLQANARHIQFYLNGQECFFQDVMAGQRISVEFAPISGSKPHVDVEMNDPNGKPIYRVYQKDYEFFKFPANITGTYKVCFSNIYDFSMYNNIVYLDFHAEDEKEGQAGPDGKAPSGPMTQLETSMVNIRDSIRIMELYQNHHRIREANGRLAAQGLHDKVLWWSIGQTTIILFVAMGQVLMLRGFFTLRKEQI